LYWDLAGNGNAATTRRPEMYALMTRSRVEPADLHAAVSIVESSLLPAAQEQPGYRGYLHLVDRATGERVHVSLWETEDDLRALYTGSHLRDQISKIRPLLIGEHDIRNYEVAVHDECGG
jgi:quinol monooxygenase YgiN